MTSSVTRNGSRGELALPLGLAGLIAAAALGGCDLHYGIGDGGTDAGMFWDAGVEDAGRDGGPGFQTDGGPDEGTDAGVDAGIDAGFQDAGQLSCLDGTAGGGWKVIAPSPAAWSFSALGFDGGILLAVSGMEVLRLDRDLNVEDSKGVTRRGGWSQPELHALTAGPVIHAESSYWGPNEAFGAMFRLGADGLPLLSADGGPDATQTYASYAQDFSYATSTASPDGEILFVVYASAGDGRIFALSMDRAGTVVAGPSEIFTLAPESEMRELVPTSITAADDGVVVAAIERMGNVAPERLRLQRFASDWSPVGSEVTLDTHYMTVLQFVPAEPRAGGTSTADVSALMRWPIPMELRRWNDLFDGGVPTTFWTPPPDHQNSILWPRASRRQFGVETVWVETTHPDGKPEEPWTGRVWAQLDGFPPVELTAATGPLMVDRDFRGVESAEVGERDRVLFTTTYTDGGWTEQLEGLSYCVPSASP